MFGAEDHSFLISDFLKSGVVTKIFGCGHLAITVMVGWNLGEDMLTHPTFSGCAQDGSILRSEIDPDTEYCQPKAFDTS